ncbi:hypothetical protein ACFL6S_26920 [Candidatus Poribacteria bacterium]
MELKSKTAKATDIEEKCTNSSIAALDILGKCAPKRMEFEFFHIALAKKWKSVELKNMKGIRVRGKRYDIVTGRCGVSFSSIISKYSK